MISARLAIATAAMGQVGGGAPGPSGGAAFHTLNLRDSVVKREK